MNEHVQQLNDTTILHPLGLLAVVVLGAAMLLVPRRQALLPLLIMACFIAPAQRIVILSLDFNLLRIMVLFGWLRVILRHEMHGFRMKPLDWVLVAWAVAGAAARTLQHGTLFMAINRAGFMFDAVGMYFLLRLLVRSWADVAAFARWAAVISVPVAGVFLVESATGRNLFSIFGGVAEHTVHRGGKLRCQGAFAHPILAGCFWASLMPLFAALLWRSASDRMIGAVGLVCAAIVIVACHSTTPMGAVAVGIVGMVLYPFRRHMTLFRWAIVAGLLGLHFLMNNPLWHLLSRIDIAGGSMGWYRYLLIDRFLAHFEEWALIGTPSTEHWWVFGLGDYTNQYVLEGVNGGLITLGLFVAVIVMAFVGMGRCHRHLERASRLPGRGRLQRQRARGIRARTTPPRAHPNVILAWAVGASLGIHCVAFVGVSYFGQIILLWYLVLAMIGSLAPVAVRRTARARARGMAVPAVSGRLVPPSDRISPCPSP